MKYNNKILKMYFFIFSCNILIMMKKQNQQHRMTVVRRWKVVTVVKLWIKRYLCQLHFKEIQAFSMHGCTFLVCNAQTWSLQVCLTVCVCRESCVTWFWWCRANTSWHTEWCCLPQATSSTSCSHVRNTSACI